MDKTTKSWMAHRVQRWHTNPHLARFGQTLADHCHGVALFVMQLHPNPSRQLIAAALLHDGGEHYVGDIPSPAKKRLPPEVMAAINEAEAAAAVALDPDWFDADELEKVDMVWLKLADMLEAYVYARHHNTAALDNTFEALKDDALTMADVLGVRSQVAEIFGV